MSLTGPLRWALAHQARALHNLPDEHNILIGIVDANQQILERGIAAPWDTRRHFSNHTNNTTLADAAGPSTTADRDTYTPANKLHNMPMTPHESATIHWSPYNRRRAALEGCRPKRLRPTPPPEQLARPWPAHAAPCSSPPFAPRPPSTWASRQTARRVVHSNRRRAVTRILQGRNQALIASSKARKASLRHTRLLPQGPVCDVIKPELYRKRLGVQLEYGHGLILVFQLNSQLQPPEHVTSNTSRGETQELLAAGDRLARNKPKCTTEQYLYCCDTLP